MWIEATLPVICSALAPGLMLHWSVFNVKCDPRILIEKGLLHVPQTLEMLGNIAAWPFMILLAVGLAKLELVEPARAAWPNLTNMREVNELDPGQEPVRGRAMRLQPNGPEAEKFLEHLRKMVTHIAEDSLRPVVEATVGTYTLRASLLEASPLLYKVAEGMGLTPVNQEQPWTSTSRGILLNLLDKVRAVLMRMSAKLEERMQMAMSTTEGNIDYINTHGTSTPAGDMKELQAVNETFGDDIPKISSTKSLSGHSLGAAGVHEAIYSLLMMENDFIVASANVDELDEAAGDIPVVTKRIDNANLKQIMSNSFGFGGTNASLVFKKYED